MLSRIGTTTMVVTGGALLALFLGTGLAAQNPATPSGGAAAATPAHAAEVLRYEIDPSHSRVTFTVRHMLVTDVDGRLSIREGWILLDTADIRNSSVDVVIDAASIDTEQERRDNHLRSADFLDVANYPEIRFTSRAVGVNETGPYLIGDLTMRGVTKEIRIPFEVRGPIDVGGGRSVIGAEGRATIDRHEFGVSWNRAIETGGMVVGDELDVRPRIEARRGG